MTGIELDPREYWEFLSGHAELVEERGWVLPDRLLATPSIDPRLKIAARMAAGVRLEFETDATEFHWQVRADAPADSSRAPSPFDIVVDGNLHTRAAITGDGVVSTGELLPGNKKIRIWLPQYGHVRLGRLRLTGASEVTEIPRGPRWIAYGSSITHCTGADGPSETWPALVAAEHGLSLRSLGFAGECQLDPPVARFIRDAGAEVISLGVGVNIHGAASFSARTLRPALEGFVDTIREGHPDTPILLVTPTFAPEREQAPNAAGLTLAEVRAEVAAVGERDDLHVVDGLTVLGPADAHLLVDKLHPGPDGYRLIARRLAPHVAALLPVKENA